MRDNSIMERWIGGCRRELLDRILIWNQNHLRQILRQYVRCPEASGQSIH